jgi:hypothetical protein
MKRTASMFLFVMAFSSCVMPQAVSCWLPTTGV